MPPFKDTIRIDFLLPFKMRSIFDVQMKRWLMSNQHRLAYERCRTGAFTRALRKREDRRAGRENRTKTNTGWRKTRKDRENYFRPVPMCTRSGVLHVRRRT